MKTKLTQTPILNSGLPDKTVQQIKAVFCKHKQIETVFLYGSRAKGNYRNGSDIDLAIQSSELTFDELLNIETELDDLMTPYSFDIVIIEKIENINLFEHIKRNGVNFYCKE